MPEFYRTKMTLAAIGLASALTVAASAQQRDMSAEAAYRDIKATLGFVPSFFKAFPQVGIAGAWGEFKAVQLSPTTALPPG